MSTAVQVAPTTGESADIDSRSVRRTPVVGLAVDRREDLVVFALALVLNLVLAAWLLGHDMIFSDGMSRVANGYYVLFSRDPHLPAVGFVWTPLPSIAALPILLLAPIVPVLHTMAAAGNIVSALCGATATMLLARALRLMGTGRGLRWALLAIFALQPLVLLGSGDGGSEPMLVATLMAALVGLLRWQRDGSPGHLVGTGVALALAYAARYEALAAGAAVLVVVFLITWWGQEQNRRAAAINDALLVGLPFAATVGLWALASKIIANQWFATFSSSYGNSAQVTTARASIDAVTGGSGVTASLGYLWRQIEVVAPLALPLSLIGVALVLVRRRWAHRLDVILIGACFASVLAFDWITFAMGRSFGWLRFQVTAVPLAVLLLGWLAARDSKAWRGIVSVLVVGSMVWTPFAWRIVTSNTALAREEWALVRSTSQRTQAALVRRIAASLDGRHLANGSIITDSAYAFPIVLASESPRQFVITSDRDFTTALADPGAHHVRYVLVERPRDAPADAVEKAYPQLFARGGGVATLVQEWRLDGDPLWRLYRFNN